MGKQVKGWTPPEDAVAEVETPVEETPQWTPPQDAIVAEPVKKKEEPKPVDLSGVDLSPLAKLSAKSTTGIPEVLSAKEYADKFRKDYAKAVTKQKEAFESIIPEVEKPKEKTTAEHISEGANNLVAGINEAITKAPSAIVKTVAEISGNVGAGLESAITGKNVEYKADQDQVVKIANKYDKMIDWLTPHEKTALTSQVGNGIGQGISMLMGGEFTEGSKIAAQGIGVLKEVAKRVFSKPTAVAFSNVFNSEYDNMKASGESDKTAFKQALSNAVVSAPLENIPIANLASRFEKAVGAPVAKRLINIVAQTGEEAGTEAIEGLFSNMTNNQLIEIEKNTKEWSEGVGESSEVGGIVGFIMSATAAALGGKVRLNSQQVHDEIKDATKGLSSDDTATIQKVAEGIDEMVKTGESSKPVTTEGVSNVQFTEPVPTTQNLEENAVQVSSPEEVLQRSQEGVGSEGGQRGGVEPVEQGVSPAGESETQEVPDQGSEAKEEVKPRTLKILTEEGGRSIPRIQRKLKDGQITPDEANAQVDELVKSGDVEFIESKPVVVEEVKPDINTQRQEEIKAASKPDVSLDFVESTNAKLDTPTGKKRIVKSGNRTVEKDETFKDKHNDIVKKQRVLKSLIDCLWR